MARQSRAQQADRLRVLPFFSHALRKNLISGSEGDGQMGFGVEFTLRQLPLAESARLGGVRSGLVPVLRRGRSASHPRQGFEILGRGAMLSLVGAEFRLGGGRTVLSQLGANIPDQVGLGNQGSEPKKYPGEDQTPSHYPTAHSLMMNEALESCKWRLLRQRGHIGYRPRAGWCSFPGEFETRSSAMSACAPNRPP